MNVLPSRIFKTPIAFLSLFLFLFAIPACKKDPHQPSRDPAKGSLKTDEYGDCSSANVVHGTWYNGFPTGTDTNYVEINVNVTRPGSYNITTYRKNGVMFSAAGNFTDTGLNTVRLKATGSFLLPGPTSYPITFDSSTCQFTIQVQDSATMSMGANTWQFTAGGHTYRGHAYGPIYQLPQNAGYSFEFTGSMESGSPDTVLQMSFWTQDIDTLSHLTSQGAYFGLLRTKDYSAIYAADRGAAPADVDIHFRSFTSFLTPVYTTIETGTFNGTVRDSARNIIPITNAKFKLVW